LPYPAPQPERKRLRDGPPLHLSKPVPVQADLFRSPPVVPNAAHTAEMPVTPEQLAETQQSDIAHFGEIVVR